MTLWRLEWLRLVRTGRLWIVVGVWALFGAVGPVSARYLSQIIERFGGIQVTVAPATPVDGMSQFLSNAGQLGLLAVVTVSAGALCIDTRREWAAFLRTRTPSVRALIVPRVVWSTAAAVAGLVAGTAIAATLTAVLIDTVSVADVVAGTLFASLYLLFVVSVVAVAASVTRQVVTTVLLSVGVLVLLPVLGLVPEIETWLPSELLGASTSLLAGGSATDLLPAAAVTVALVPGLLAMAVRRLQAREL